MELLTIIGIIAVFYFIRKAFRKIGRWLQDTGDKLMQFSEGLRGTNSSAYKQEKEKTQKEIESVHRAINANTEKMRQALSAFRDKHDGVYGDAETVEDYLKKARLEIEELTDGKE